MSSYHSFRVGRIEKVQTRIFVLQFLFGIGGFYFAICRLIRVRPMYYVCSADIVRIGEEVYLHAQRSNQFLYLWPST